ncbi:MAG: hypothetical protein ACJ8IK_30225 [Burkholderiaceae bacterium]
MALRVRDQQQPLTDVGPSGRHAIASTILAECAAGDLLLNELERYCGRKVEGRSILLAGLRGVGKTTLATAAVQKVMHLAEDGTRLPMRPLHVVLLGPNLFLDSRGRAADDEKRTRGRVLEQVVLGIYAALSQELVRGFRDLARMAAQDRARQHFGLELAAALETRLPEGPPLSELREFWRSADALQTGVLFRNCRRPGQGMLELSALSGMGYAYQRVSGKFTQSNQSTTSSSTSDERSSGLDLRLADAVKPLASVGSGAAIAAAAASAHGLATSLVAGLASALAAGALFRFASTTARKQEDKRDYTFLPDTRPETLDRVLPALISRLKVAGLAPVIIFDELDKVDDLWTRHDALLKNMKKLFAETLYTCSLVNRNFMEQLRAAQEGDPYGRNFSYFTHRSYVSYEPRAMHDYLDRIIMVADGH